MNLTSHRHKFASAQMAQNCKMTILITENCSTQTKKILTAQFFSKLINSSTPPRPIPSELYSEKHSYYYETIIQEVLIYPMSD